MKKVFVLAFAAALLLLCACGAKSDVQYHIGKSELYMEEELKEAVQTAEDCFAENFKGCTLKEIAYDEDFSLQTAADWAEQYGAEEAVVLTSAFQTDSAGGDGSLEPNSTYEGWQWILVRSPGEAWTVKTWGYG